LTSAEIFGQKYLINIPSDIKEIVSNVIEKYLQSIGETESEMNEISKNLGRTPFRITA
jgi:hypothetical protein